MPKSIIQTLARPVSSYTNNKELPTTWPHRSIRGGGGQNAANEQRSQFNSWRARISEPLLFMHAHVCGPVPIYLLRGSSTGASQRQVHSQNRRMLSPKTPRRGRSYCDFSVDSHECWTVILPWTRASGTALRTGHRGGRGLPRERRRRERPPASRAMHGAAQETWRQYHVDRACTSAFRRERPRAQ